MHRALVALLGLGLSLGLAGAVGLDTSETPLQRTSTAPAPSAPAEDPAPVAPCIPLLAARAAATHVALSWSECEGTSFYHLLRGPTLDTLEPLVEVDHASHVDIAPAPVAFYAVRAAGGPLSAPVVVALG